VTWKGAIPGREQDVLGLGFAYARIGARARRSDTDRAFYDPSGFNPIRNAESVVELTYAAQVAPWWTVQPDLQYIINPGAGIPNQNDPTRTIRNALLLGLVTMITF
jgi:porin